MSNLVLWRRVCRNNDRDTRGNRSRTSLENRFPVPFCMVRTANLSFCPPDRTKAKKPSSHYVYRVVIHEWPLMGVFCRPFRLPGPSGSGQIKRPLDKKLRRQIANCNERRRMQSINAGFHTLRVLMPHLQGEKLSKVCCGYNIISFSCPFPSDSTYVFSHILGCCTTACSRAHLPAKPRAREATPAEHISQSHAVQILAKRGPQFRRGVPGCQSEQGYQSTLF